MLKKEYNEGIALMRVFLTFAVILNHFWKVKDPGFLRPLYLFRSCAVPVFMMLSFYLTERSISFPAKEKINKRISRLAWPFFAWGGGKLAYSLHSRTHTWSGHNRWNTSVILATCYRTCISC